MTNPVNLSSPTDVEPVANTDKGKSDLQTTNPTVNEIRDTYHRSLHFSKDLQKAFAEASSQARLENENFERKEIWQHTYITDESFSAPEPRHERANEDSTE